MVTPQVKQHPFLPAADHAVAPAVAHRFVADLAGEPHQCVAARVISVSNFPGCIAAGENAGEDQRCQAASAAVLPTIP